MREVAEILAAMLEKGVTLWVDEGQLRYRSKKGILSGDEIVALRELKAEIIDVLMRRGTSLRPPNPSPPNWPPLTVQQQALLSVIQPGSDFPFMVPIVLRLRGPLHIECLRQSIEELVRRHSSLRTRIVCVDGVPRQWIDAPCKFELEIMLFDAASKDKNENDARRFVGEFAARRRDVADGPLFDVRLLRFSPYEYVLVLVTHHIVTDGFSSNIMVREISLLYDAVLQGTPSPLQQMPAQYGDYARWQQGTSDVWLKKDEPYWNKHLDGAERLKVSDDHPGGIAGEDPQELTAAFGEKVSSRVRGVARRKGTSPALVALAAYAATLSQWCRQKDFIVAFLDNGRHEPEHEHMIGALAQFLCLRMQLTDNDTFSALLSRVDREYHTACEHRDFSRIVKRMPELSFGTTVEWVPRSLQWSPRVRDGVVGLVAAESSNQFAHDVVAEPFPFDAAQAFATAWARSGPSIRTSFFDMGGSISVTVSSRAGVFSGKAMQQFVCSLRSSMEQLVRNPSARISDIYREARHIPQKITEFIVN